jgi:PHD/YefM family antitoxin component YafN of YafNO toxin-antitoxin module
MQRMAKMAVSEARERLPEAMELARSEAVFLERYGKPAAVLVSPDRYSDNIPWEQVTSDLGWMSPAIE